MSVQVDPQYRKKQARKINFMRLITFLVLIVICIWIGQFGYNVYEEYEHGYTKSSVSGKEPQSVEVVITKGASTGEIARILEQKSLIRYPDLFRLASKLKQKDGKYRQGTFLLNSSMGYETLMSELTDVKKNNNVRFTIPEGYEIRQIADVLSKQQLVNRERFYSILEKQYLEYPFLKDVPKRSNRLEGYLFPDTYEIYPNTSEEQIVKMMLDRFHQIFEDRYYIRAKQLGMTVDQVVILASMIEREAKLSKERAYVSSVFHNRLKSKQYPKLQSCATVQYILKERKPILSVEDTKINSPYNTYIYNGLPVGPIACPGKASIEAALYPAQSDYLFFVANSDGSHIYSKTYAEHLKAMQKVQ